MYSFERTADVEQEIISDINYSNRNIGPRHGKDVKPVRVITDEDIKAERQKRNAELKKMSYLSNQDARGTNMEFYIRKGRAIFVNPRLQNFINNIDPLQVDEKLWDLIGGKNKGTLRSIRKAKNYIISNLDELNDYTIEQASKYLFKGGIKSKEQLRHLAENADKFYALQWVYYDKDNAKLLDIEIPEEALDTIELEFKERPTALKRYEEGIEYARMYKGHVADPDVPHLMASFLMYYDGTVQSGMHAFNEAKWEVVHRRDVGGKAETKESVNRKGESYEVDSAYDKANPDIAMLAVETEFVDNLDRSELVNAVYNYYMEYWAMKLAKQGKSREFVAKKLTELYDTVERMSQEALKEEYKKISGKSVTVEKVTTAEDTEKITSTEEQDIADLEANKDVPTYSVRTNARTRIKYNATRIRKTVPQKDWKRFLLENGDIFNEDLTLKPEAYANKTQEELDKLLERMLNIRDKAKANAYSNKKLMANFDSLRNKNKKLQQKVTALQGEPETGLNKVRTRVYTFGDNSVTIDSSIEMPDFLRKLFETNLTHTYKTDVTDLSEKDEVHTRMSLREFLAENSEWLGQLSESQVARMVDFFAKMSIHGQTNDETARRFNAFSVYILAYASGLIEDGSVNVSSETKEKAREALQLQVSSAGTLLAAFKNVVAYGRSQSEAFNSIVYYMKSTEAQSEVFKANCKKNGVVVNEEQATELIKATKTQDIKRIEAAIEAIRKNLTEQYKGKKRDLFDKLIALQRAAMLSSPGTMMRNVVSNIIVTGANDASNLIGRVVLGFLKKFDRFNVKGQYILTGTKVSKEVAEFIQVHFKDSGLLALVQDGLTKYDSRSYTC